MCVINYLLHYLSSPHSKKSLVGFYNPDVSNCPKAIESVYKIYTEGDLQNKAAVHRSLIFYDKQGCSANECGAIKAIDAIRKKN